jgi:hypothetical protein
MSNTEVRTYEDFWPHYVRAHSKASTRLIHAVGTSAALACVAAFAITRKKAFLTAAPIAGYGFAWYSHFFVEGNKPATFGNPLWSLRGDFEMMVRMMTGTMDAEVERYCHTQEAADANTGSDASPSVESTLN